MSITIIVLTGVILFVCSTIQGAVGFAFNIFAIPMLIWSGLSLPQAITVTSIPIFMQSLTSTYKLRKYIKWKDVAKGTFFRYLGLPLGIYLLTLINDFDKNNIKQIVGIVILLIVAVQLLFKVKPKEEIGWFWSILSFLSSGIFLGMISMGGPPVILWVMAHRWNALEIRAFLSALFFLASPFLLVLLYYNFGKELVYYFVIGLSFTPVVILGTLFGVKLGNLLDHKKLKRIVMSLLVLTSIVSIVSPYFN